MDKIAFLFPGQGSQSTGMGKSLAEAFPAARLVFEEADDTLGFAISTLCFEGPDEDLRLTENTQPALLTVSCAAAAVLAESGIEPAYVAGHSLGEYSALVAAGSLRFAEAVVLVRKRGIYMQQAVPAGAGSMAAFLRLPEGALEGILARAAEGEVVSAANWNSPGQVVIAGHTGAVSRAMELAKEAGARKVTALAVSAPFHCALMMPAQEHLEVDLDATHFADLRVPLVNNWEAREIHTAEDARRGLYEQVPNPVRWTESMQYLAEHGVSRYIEVGPGKVLSGLLRNIVPGAVCELFGEAEHLEKLQTAAV